MKVTLVGIGTDGKNTLTMQAAETIRGASLLIGAARMLQPFETEGKRTVNCYDSRKIADLLYEAASQEMSAAAVLFSGDTGFYSGAGSLLRILKEDEAAGKSPLDVMVLPGISSLCALCAKTGISYEEMQIVSLHGRRDSIAVHVRMHEKTFFVLGGRTDAAVLCRTLCEYGLSDVRVHVGENLGLEGERIVSGAAVELCKLETSYLTCVIAVNPAPLEYLPCGIADDAFERIRKTDNGARRTIPMTKAKVRAAAVGALQIRRRDVCWDVGCGTGSVSVEMAFHCPGGFVYGFDREEDAAALTLHNARRFSCDNISAQVMDFPPEAEEERKALPVPDRVFIGGAGGRIGEIVHLAKVLNPACRIVITAVSLETLEEGRAALETACGGCEIVQMGVSQGAKTGRVTMMKAFNPVFILTGE